MHNWTGGTAIYIESTLPKLGKRSYFFGESVSQDQSLRLLRAQIKEWSNFTGVCVSVSVCRCVETSCRNFSADQSRCCVGLWEKWVRTCQSQRQRRQQSSTRMTGSWLAPPPCRDGGLVSSSAQCGTLYHSPGHWACDAAGSHQQCWNQVVGCWHPDCGKLVNFQLNMY